MPNASRNTGIVRLALAALLVLAADAAADVKWTPGGIRVSLERAGAGRVEIAGSFNNWTGEPLDRESSGVWSKILRVGPGVHEYKFVVDGEWIGDPDNPVTMGDFGNSAFNVGEDGRLAAMESASNTDYSAKILVTGRMIGLYQSRKDPEDDGRFELRRPGFDTDLGFGIRLNDVMDARILTNINNENEADAVQPFRTRLNFDRGYMHFDTEDIEGWAWDNDDMGAWDDPLHLVGDVGIYHHNFGFGLQGAMVRREIGGVDFRLLYADNFVPGGQNAPTLGFPYTDLAGGESALELVDGVYVLPGQRLYALTITPADEDILAVRARRDWNGFTFGASGRVDRHYNPGAFGLVQGVVPDTLRLEYAYQIGGVDMTDTLAVPGFSGTRRAYTRASSERWWGAGVDVGREDLWEGVDVTIEALYGKAEFIGRFGERDFVFFGTVPDTITVTGAMGDTTLTGTQELVAVTGEDPLIADPSRRVAAAVLDTEAFDVDESWRLHLGLAELPEVLGVRASTSLELETHSFDPLTIGLAEKVDNSAWTWRADAVRPARVAGRDFRPRIGLEFTYFDYDPDTRWEMQPWFPTRNFWLEHGEHEVEYEKLTLLGGADALILRPGFDLEIDAARGIRVEYDGTIAGPGFGKEPSYVETILRGRWQIARQWRFLADLRFAKYNHRLLDLNDSYNETFLEVAYLVDEGIELALSYGVDPWIIDEPVNEYAYIGRDAFLFDRGANAATAEINYIGLRNAILAAESALANERVLQVEAIVRF